MSGSHLGWHRVGADGHHAARNGTSACAVESLPFAELHAGSQHGERGDIAAVEREFDDAPNGIIGLETALGLALTELVHGGLIDLPTLIVRMTTAPARVFKLPGGTLARGAVGDVVVIDPAVEWTVDPDRFYSKSRNTPFAGRRLRGRADATIVRGQLVHRHTG